MASEHERELNDEAAAIESEMAQIRDMANPSKEGADAAAEQRLAFLSAKLVAANKQQEQTVAKDELTASLLDDDHKAKTNAAKAEEKKLEADLEDAGIRGGVHDGVRYVREWGIAHITPTREKASRHFGHKEPLGEDPSQQSKLTAAKVVSALFVATSLAFLLNGLGFQGGRLALKSPVMLILALGFGFLVGFLVSHIIFEVFRKLGHAQADAEGDSSNQDKGEDGGQIGHGSRPPDSPGHVGIRNSDRKGGLR